MSYDDQRENFEDEPYRYDNGENPHFYGDDPNHHEQYHTQDQQQHYDDYADPRYTIDDQENYDEYANDDPRYTIDDQEHYNEPRHSSQNQHPNSRASHYSAPGPSSQRYSAPAHSRKQAYDDRNSVYSDGQDNHVAYGEPMEEAQEQQEEEPKRQFKYSTADMPERSRCRKFCMIILLFLLFMAFSTGLSMLLNHFFFSGESDNAPTLPERDPNATFPLDRTSVDQACSRGSFAADEGETCREVCEPQFFKCCDPFNEFVLYNITDDSTNANNATNDNSTSPTNGTSAVLNPNTTLEQAGELQQQEEELVCSLDTELRGCMSYAKCQALGGLIDPAPATLPILCGQHGLETDPVSCQEICKRVRCCFATEDSCLHDNFDICSDWAPCQNLREGFTVETAPAELDQLCFYQLPECFEICEKAECCGDPTSSCFQDNFMSCLTYAPCNNITTTNIVLAPQFSVLEQPPAEIVYACGEHHEAITINGQNQQVPVEPVNKTCPEYCEAALCCWAAIEDNCFFEDPLGCLAWEQQCQVLFQDAPTTRK